MSILSVFLQRKEGCAVEDCTALGFCFSCSFLRSGSLFILFAGPPPCTRRPLLKKGSIRKLFCGWQHIFHGRAKNPECRNRCFSGWRSMDSGCRDLWAPVVAPSLTLFAGPPPCTPATPFEKGVDPKTLSADGQHTFYGRAKNPVCRSRCFFGNRSMDSGRRPLCGCFVLSCMVGGIFRKPLGFRRCLPPARPEKAKPFQAGRSPCTKH